MIVHTEHTKVTTIEDYLLHKARDPEWVMENDGQLAFDGDGHTLSVTRIREYVVIADQGVYEGVTKCESLEAAAQLAETYGAAGQWDIYVNAHDRTVWCGETRTTIVTPNTPYDSDDAWLKAVGPLIKEHCEQSGVWPTAWVSYDRYGTAVGYLHDDGSVTDLNVLQ